MFVATLVPAEHRPRILTGTPHRPTSRPLDGGHSSVGRAPGCGLGCHGFESRCSPHPSRMLIPSRMIRDRTAGLVLAGGEARRMGGGDKPLLTVGRQTMLAAIIAA